MFCARSTPSFISVVGSSQCCLQHASSNGSCAANTAARKESASIYSQRLTSTANSPIQDAYILGPGDAVVVELLDVPEYSGIFTIGPDGTIYLPRLRSISVEGLTVEELRSLLTKQFSEYVLDPQVFVNPAIYRPIRVYIGGEVSRPGYYYLSGQQSAVGAETYSFNGPDLATNQYGITDSTEKARVNPATSVGPRIGGSAINLGLRLPTVFDALRNAGGVTPFPSSARCPSPAIAHSAAAEGRCEQPSISLLLLRRENESQKHPPFRWRHSGGRSISCGTA